MELSQRISTAMGNEPVDLLLKNGQIVNVFSGIIHEGDIAIKDGIILGFGEYEAKTVVDVKGKFICPGFIDGHIHLESSMLSVSELSRNLVPLGTTAVVTDPHELANVYGIEGVKYILDSSESLPLSVFVMFPSCVPATPFETSGSKISAEDMRPFVDHPRVLGLAEMMNYPGVIFSDPEVLAKIKIFGDKVKDGHAPGLSGKELIAYVNAGIGSDHECSSSAEANEKLSLGMRIMIREGSAAKNMDELLPILNGHNSRNLMLVSDDLDPFDIVEKGHLNKLVRMAISKGVNPITALQMVTINPATYFRIKDRGAILPGYQADIVVLEDLETIQVHSVYKSGVLAAIEGKFIYEMDERNKISTPLSFNVDWSKITNFDIPANSEQVNVIEIVPNQIFTRRAIMKPAQKNGKLQSDTSQDILKMAVIERHHGSGSHATAFIKGFGLGSGAIASSVAHDSHNIIVVGENDKDMMGAAKKIAEMGGGMVVVRDDTVMASLALPIGGLMSDRPITEVQSDLKNLGECAKLLGCKLEAPFATLSFMALTPIPEIKLTDKGLFDSLNFRFLSLFETTS
ncbi:MAG: adenine deaminase [Syntrophaceae bacterium]|nr:adenine deaminase [Syntrophaceae bacterium]